LLELHTTGISRNLLELHTTGISRNLLELHTIGISRNLLQLQIMGMSVRLLPLQTIDLFKGPGRISFSLCRKYKLATARVLVCHFGVPFRNFKLKNKWRNFRFLHYKKIEEPG
jgi:hypothetical protein